MSRLPLDMTEAFVLGAGMGTRLRPVTDDLPKPLVPIFQKPLVTFAFDHLIAGGVERLIVNTHRLPERFSEIFPDSVYRDRRILFLHEPHLLGTGGGLKNALPHFSGESVVVYSGDVLTDFELAPLLDEHARAGNEVTLALRETSFAPTITLRRGRVVEISNGKGKGGDYDFANVSIWTRKAADLIPENRSVSFIPTLVQAIAEGSRIGGVVVNDGRWFNIGSVRGYLDVHRSVTLENWRPAYLDNAVEWPVAIAADACVDATVHLSGFYSIGADCRVGAGVKLTDSILWPGAQIASGSELRNCIVRGHRVAEGILRDAIV
jgi:mannose-1-phosphate guanylyltransferase